VAAYSLDRFAADVVCVADALGMERFCLFGISMGGMVAQRVVLEHPDRVEALMLSNTSACSPPDIAAAPVETAAHVALTQGLPELKRRMDAQGGDLVATGAHRRLLARDPGYKEYGDRKFLDQSPHMYAAIVRQLARLPDLVDALGQVRCPTLVLVGEEDEVFRPECERLAAAIPGARYEVIPPGGHSPQFEAPEAFFAVVEEFLALLDRP
jgi:pimeloyl-ACP methyl ester carboxylesterase